MNIILCSILLRILQPIVPEFAVTCSNILKTIGQIFLLDCIELQLTEFWTLWQLDWRYSSKPAWILRRSPIDRKNCKMSFLLPSGAYVQKYWIFGEQCVVHLFVAKEVDGKVCAQEFVYLKTWSRMNLDSCLIIETKNLIT